ncbi:Mesoderm development candidate [Heracleum sosnowskyi]|uniref:Mesoderm development candidate n=1 Tax=Heracleum sosnowskyi TaxID=360622 RepID=A0AAD8GNE2_9APIA|nr:Mesoderm development candidate [Heracleum sosnowskyi]
MNYKHTFLLLLIIAQATINFDLVDAGKRRRVHIPDDLNDVVDNEEDDAWKQWGQTKSSPGSDLPDIDFSQQTDFSKLQTDLMKHQTGPAFGFVKLRLGQKRKPDMVSDLAMQWTKLAKTGTVDVKFMGVDLSTIMFTLEKGQDSFELKDFVLNQPDAYEVKIGDKIFRRPGDPPFDDVFQKHYGDQDMVDFTSSAKNDKHEKDEL